MKKIMEGYLSCHQGRIFSRIVFLGAAAAIIVSGFFLANYQVKAASPGDVLINEFRLDGTQWVELINTTASDINLASSTWELVTTVSGPGAGTTTLSGVIPANGLLTFTPNALATTTYQTLLSLKNDGTTIYAVSYGSSTPFGVEPLFDSFPAAGESVVLAGGVYSATSTANITRGWYNEAPAPTITSIVATINASGVATNMSTSTDNTAVTGLYFEKRTDVSSSTTALGRLTFAGPLNLTNASTTALLQALGTKMESAAGSMKFDARTAADLQNAGAVVSIYKINDIGYDVSSLSLSSMTVKDDLGVVIATSSGSFPALSGVATSTDNGGTFEFTTSHFTQFGFNPILLEVTPVAALTASVSPTYTFSSNVAGTYINGGGCNGTGSTTIGNNTIQLGPLPPGTYAGCTVEVIDGAGASSTLAITSFIEVDTDADTAAVAADKAALVAGLIQGSNADLSNIIAALTNPLPSAGTASSSVITWVSASTTLVSNDGQTVNRPAIGNPDATTTLTATITKNLITDTKVFTLTVLALLSTDATVTSGTYTVNNGSSTITGVPYGTASSTFLASTTKGQINQTWNISDISNPVVTGDTLVVTAQDASTTKTYTITVDLPIMTGTVEITGTTKFGSTLTASSTLTNSGTSTYQWKRDGSAISGATSSTYVLVEADITAAITVTVTAQAGVATGSITSTATAAVSKADGPAAPSAPTEASKTSSSITLTANALNQFSKDAGVTWQDSEVFSGLSASTAYTFRARVKATATTNESAASDGTSITTSASSGGGGGVINTPVCTDVTYSDYTAGCVSGYQYRNVTARSPLNCTLTAAQQEATKKVCGVTSVTNDVTAEVKGTGLTSGDSNNTANFIAREKNLVKKINKALTKRLGGRILLQVEERGEAWYVNPIDLLKYYLGSPADAFAIMRKLALGISNKNFDSFNGKAPSRLAGRILLKVEDHGKAYYVNPLDLKLNYLGSPADAFSVMRSLGLGITNANLRQINLSEVK